MDVCTMLGYNLLMTDMGAREVREKLGEEIPYLVVRCQVLLLDLLAHLRMRPSAKSVMADSVMTGGLEVKRPHHK